MPTNFSKVDKLVNQTMKAGLVQLGNDVKKRSQILSPILTGALRRSARVDVSNNGDKVTISYNTPYARIREFSNRKHPATVGYLRNSLKSIKNLNKYFKKFN